MKAETLQDCIRNN